MRKAEGIFHYILIQDRAPGLQGIFHGSPVHLTQNVSGKIRIHIQKHPADLPVFLLIGAFPWIAAVHSLTGSKGSCHIQICRRADLGFQLRIAVFRYGTYLYRKPFLQLCPS